MHDIIIVQHSSNRVPVLLAGMRQVAFLVLSRTVAGRLRPGWKAWHSVDLHCVLPTAVVRFFVARYLHTPVLDLVWLCENGQARVVPASRVVCLPSFLLRRRVYCVLVRIGHSGGVSGIMQDSRALKRSDKR